MQTTDYAGYIRRAFMSDGLMGTVAKLPLERKFKLEHVKEVLLRTMIRSLGPDEPQEGFQPVCISVQWLMQLPPVVLACS